MKKIYQCICISMLFVVGIASCFLSASVWAYNNDPSVESDVRGAYLAQQSRYFVAAPVAEKKHSFDLGYELYNYKYEETVKGSEFMNTKGNYSGYALDYVYRPGASSYYGEYIDEYRLQARVAFGDVDYTGSGTYKGLEDYMFELRGLLAKSYDVGGMATVVPYVGVGFRYLNNGAEEMPANATTYSGYNRESRYVYLPLGADLRTRVNGGWDLSMNLEYDHFIDGEQQSHLEDQRDISGNDPGYSNLVNEQNKGFGLRGAVKLSKDISKRVNLFIEPFFRYWDIEDSKFTPFVINGVTQCDATGCYGGVEPSNVTKEIGLKMGVGF